MCVCVCVCDTVGQLEFQEYSILYPGLCIPRMRKPAARPWQPAVLPPTAAAVCQLVVNGHATHLHVVNLIGKGFFCLGIFFQKMKCAVKRNRLLCCISKAKKDVFNEPAVPRLVGALLWWSVVHVRVDCIGG